MDVSFLLKGMLIGFSIAAPVGPVGVLCIRRTLADGRSAGLVSGLGAATADMLYGSMAAFGLTFVASLLIDGLTLFRLVGGGFLLYLGIKTLRSRPATQEVALNAANLWSAYASTFFYTLTNPMTVLSFAAIFAGVGLASAERDYLSASVVVVGVFLGSASWWLILSGGVGLLRTRFNSNWLLWVNRLSGVIIAGFGLRELLRLVL
jgi:threonine/homoserine/homoserine lactone efflux protein